MPKKHAPLTCEFFAEDLSNIPQELDDLIDAVDLAFAGNGSQLADLILTTDIISTLPKELVAELIRNTKKSKRPIIKKITQLNLKHSDDTKNEPILTGRSISYIPLEARETITGRPPNKDTSKRDSKIYDEYKEQIKNTPKWQCLQTLSTKYNLSESTIEDILKLQSKIDTHGCVHLGNGKFVMKRGYLFGKEYPKMGDKSE